MTDIACGPNHMVAVCRVHFKVSKPKTTNKKVSILYAWGANEHNQLGVKEEGD